jgi:tRNA nucleotidyltransferase (CCA-adding enzyme)
MEIFLVGGAVRDEIMGKQPKDFDFTVVLPVGSYRDPFEFMVEELEKKGFKIFQKNPEHLTVRAQFPVASGGFLDGLTNIPGGTIKPGKKRLTADFVLARKEGTYTDGRRPDSVSPGTLMDDLARRDFTMNAIAKDSEGNFFDPFNGREDIANGLIRAVGDPKAKMMEDALRVMRALRFNIQLGFGIHPETEDTLYDREVLRALRDNIKDERIMDELNKMFKANSLESLHQLSYYYALGNVIFSGKVNLEATMKQKGFQ